MSTEYLRLVVIYLKQELPEYQEMLVVKDNQIVFTVHPGAAFEQFYQRVFNSVSECTSRIRNREIDLEFKVWSPAQERDFKVLK
jgi:pentose-5-phosphate-3-epimerase